MMTRNAGRRAEDAAVKIQVTKQFSGKSSELQAARRELDKGHTVLLSPIPARNNVHSRKMTVKTGMSGYKLTGTDVVTALSGGAALGIAALAVAPASAVLATIAAIAGVALGGAARKLD
jgi:hypothetical protein